MNRIVEVSKRYSQKIATFSHEKREKLERDLDIDLSEIVAYQQEKSLAQLEGLISLDEASTIYDALNCWNETPLETKVAVTLGMGELIKRRLKK